MTNGEWIPKSVGGYDKRTQAEVGIYYESYNATLEEIAQRARLTRGATAIDIASGTGTLAIEIAARYGCRVVGLDPSKAMVAFARRKARAANVAGVKFLVAEAPFLCLPASPAAADLVVTTYAFHHVPDADKAGAVEEMARVLRPAGRIMIGDIMFADRKALRQALREHRDELEPEYFCTTSGLARIFRALRLEFGFDQIGPITWLASAKKTGGN
jgi:putative AdoMet-dependent methyltransferase